MKKLSILDWTTLAIVIAGGINWGLEGIFNFNVIGAILGDMSIASRFIYALIGICTLYIAIISPAFMRASEPLRE
jgi:uncharacterized membrane protein YuzA (DUF378 family)